MLSAGQDNVSTRIRKENADQRERPIDIDVERSSVGNPVHDANTCPFGFAIEVLYRPAINRDRERHDNQERNGAQDEESNPNLTRDSYHSRHRRLPRNRTKETRRTGRRVSLTWIVFISPRINKPAALSPTTLGTEPIAARALPQSARRPQPLAEPNPMRAANLRRAARSRSRVPTPPPNASRPRIAPSDRASQLAALGVSRAGLSASPMVRSEEHTSELQ